MSNSATAARRSAIYLLDQILGEGRLLPECLSAGALDRLAPEDRARAQRLTIETLPAVPDKLFLISFIHIVILII